VNALIDIGCAEVIVNMAQAKADITFDPDVVTLEQIKAEIEEIGFDV
jgi:copper chaperone CopZ